MFRPRSLQLLRELAAISMTLPDGKVENISLSEEISLTAAPRSDMMIALPDQLMWWGLKLAGAKKRLREAESRLVDTEASVVLLTREGLKKSGDKYASASVLDAEVSCHPTIKDLRAAVRAAQEDADVLDAIVKALTHKSRMLSGLDQTEREESGSRRA